MRRCRPRGCAAGGMLELGRARAAETGCRLRPRAGGSDNTASSTGFGWADGWMAMVAFKKGLGHGQKGWLEAGDQGAGKGLIVRSQRLGWDERVALLAEMAEMGRCVAGAKVHVARTGVYRQLRRHKAKGSWFGGC